MGVIRKVPLPVLVALAVVNTLASALVVAVWWGSIWPNLAASWALTMPTVVAVVRSAAKAAADDLADHREQIAADVAAQLAEHREAITQHITAATGTPPPQDGGGHAGR